jgi:hypothetical protein
MKITPTTQTHNGYAMSTTAVAFVKSLREKDVQVGDVVHLRNKPHYVYDIRPDCIVIVSMDERKVYTTLRDGKG